ncbi:penicillin-binding protein activator LpoB [Lentisphaerota bacterium ZTH]|nr:penicillin-binding protein activator LpoB [Lentisphaerota bacterium]WET05641.1 penicillin-binding protein activator LpoB [Lentisphaerota bacterium ZTH]
MKLRLIMMAAVIGIAGFMLAGCGTDPHRIDPSSNQGLTTVDDINFKDWQIAGEKCVKTMLDSGVLKRNDGRKTVIMISTVKNSTSQHVNTRLLTDRIRLAVLRSGQAITTTAVSGKGAEDNASRQVRKLADDEMFNKKTVVKQGTAIAPEMSLAGEIVQQKTKSGRTSESYFFIHMTLTDLKTGLAVWEDNVEIAKQAKKPWLGW